MNTAWKRIELEGWERRHIYEGFRSCEFPFLVVGANLELGHAPEHWKAAGLSAYLACVYSVCKAANEVPAFRQRVRGQDVIEYERVHADFTIPAGQASFSVKQVPFSPDFRDFYGRAATDNDAGFITPGDITELDHWIFMSCLPWISFTHVMQPMHSLRRDTIPRFVWGKFFKEGSRWKMPISVQANHSLVDGIHVAQLFATLEAGFADAEQTFPAVEETVARRG